MMALPLTWRPGAANPFGQGPKMRSIPVCHVDHDLGASAQGGLERAQAGPAERTLGGSATPKIDDSAPRIEGRAEPALRGVPLSGRKLVVRELSRDRAVERASHLE